MDAIVECVPNFSEGRRKEVVDEIVGQITSVGDVKLLDHSMDHDHNRAVVTFIGTPEAVKEAAFNAAKKAADLIDLTKHEGEHPRMGATDVIPFVPIKGIDVDGCVEIAREVGKRIGDELEIPVFLYESAATRPERKNLSKVRKGQFEGLREQIGENPEKRPDFGPEKIHPTAGATAVGARFFLVAYNVNLDTPDVKIAKKIGKEIRESSGGFPAVKALGMEIAERNISQVSMNLVNYKVTSMYKIFDEIEKRANAQDVNVIESEIIGLVPLEALEQGDREKLKLAGFSEDQIIENRIG